MTKPDTRTDARAARLAQQRQAAAITFGPAPRPGPRDEPTRYSLAILAGINAKGGPVFAGIVTHAVGQHPTKPLARRLAQRRAANRAARTSRRINRKAAA